MSEKEDIGCEKERLAQLLERSKRHEPYLIQLKAVSNISQQPLLKAIIGIFPQDLCEVKLGSFFDRLFNQKLNGSSIIRRLLKLAHGIVVSEKDLIRYLDQGLVFWGSEDDPGRIVTLYDIFYRLPLIWKCEKNLKYNVSRIRQITELDYRYLALMSEPRIGLNKNKQLSRFQDLSGSPPVFLRKYLEWRFDWIELYEGQSEERVSSPSAVKVQTGYIDVLEYLANFDYDKASVKKKELLRRLGILVWYLHERWKLNFLGYYHEPVYRGYSPQVQFQKYEEVDDAWFVPSGEIDWSMTLDFTKLRKSLSFFRTPEFEVEFNEGQISIQVFEPAKVDSSVMRNVEKVYSIFRQKLNPSGKKRGPSKKTIDKTSEIYKRIREEYLRIGRESNLRQPQRFDELEKKGFCYSEEHFRKIIYVFSKRC